MFTDLNTITRILVDSKWIDVKLGTFEILSYSTEGKEFATFISFHIEEKGEVWQRTEVYLKDIKVITRTL